LEVRQKLALRSERWTMTGEPRSTSGAFALAVDVSLNLFHLEGLLERLAQHP